MKIIFCTLFFISHSLAFAATNEFFDDLESFQKNGLSIKSQRATLEASQDSRLAKSLFWTPSLSLSAAKSKTTVNSTSTSDQDYWMASASVNLFKGGADLADLDEAKANESAQQINLISEELSVELSAANLIFKSLYLKNSLRAQNDQLKLKEDSLKIVKERYSQGKTPLQEVSKAEIELSQQKNKVRNAELSVVENEKEIKSSFVVQIKTKDWPISLKQSFKFLKEDDLATDHLPTVESKFFKSKSYEFELASHKRTYWPKLDFTAQYQESPLSSRDQKQIGTTLLLTIPIWSKYETASSISSAHANFIAADAEYQIAKKKAGLNRLYYSQKVQVASQNLQEAQSNLEKSKRLYLDMIKSYRLGRLSTNDLFIEQNRLISVELETANSEFTYHQTIAEYCTLLGMKISSCVNRQN